MAAAEAVALQNGTYFHYGLKRQFKTCKPWSKSPPDF